MTIKYETDITLYKKAAEYALKEALKSDKKTLDKSDKERLDWAMKNFFEQYDRYVSKH